MPIKKLRIGFTAKVRGTADAEAIIELICENWEDFQSSHSKYSENELDELIAHFNNAVEDLGHQLFGEEPSAIDFRTFSNALDEK